MKVVVLGSAAGGGFPQWNCNCHNCQRVRSGDPAFKPRTQSSVAVSADGQRWLVLNASPDIRQQIQENPSLHPGCGSRHSPISAVMLTNADVDHVAGLLTLRERQAFNLYATARVLQVLESNTIFNVLDSRLVERISLPTDVRTGIVDTNGHSLGLEVDAFPIPGKIALYLEDPHSENMGSVDQDTIGIQVTDSTGGGRFFYLPGCASMPKELGERLKNAELVLMDGTTWIDDEMSQQGVGEKTARRMGHMAISGDSGTIRAFKDLNVARKVFVHINNTNPVLNEGSDEYKATLKAGWTVATDGLELTV